MKLVVDADPLLLLATVLVELEIPMRLGKPVGDRLGSDAVPVTLPLP